MLRSLVRVKGARCVGEMGVSAWCMGVSKESNNLVQPPLSSDFLEALPWCLFHRRALPSAPARSGRAWVVTCGDTRNVIFPHFRICESPS